MWIRSELKARGKARFRANYWPCVLAGFLLSLSGGSSIVSLQYTTNQNSSDYGYGSYGYNPFFHIPEGLMGFLVAFGAVLVLATILISIFILAPLQVGCYRFFLVNALQNAETSEIGRPFSKSYMNTVLVMFLTSLFTALWSLLLIVPGIIKAYAWRFVPYILAEKPDIDQKEARELSAAMMNGHKWNAFVYDLSFIGWIFLGVLTLGLLNLFYVNPYKGASDAELYLAIRTQS